MDDRTSEKKERLLAALDHGLVMVHLDARRPGVVVPAELRCESHLRLNLSYRFEPPDLSVGEWGIRSTLSFSGSASPWQSRGARCLASPAMQPRVLDVSR